MCHPVSLLTLSHTKNLLLLHCLCTMLLTCIWHDTATSIQHMDIWSDSLGGRTKVTLISHSVIYYENYTWQHCILCTTDPVTAQLVPFVLPMKLLQPILLWWLLYIRMWTVVMVTISSWENPSFSIQCNNLSPNVLAKFCFCLQSSVYKIYRFVTVVINICNCHSSVQYPMSCLFYLRTWRFIAWILCLSSGGAFSDGSSRKSLFLSLYFDL